MPRLTAPHRPAPAEKPQGPPFGRPHWATASPDWAASSSNPSRALVQSWCPRLLALSSASTDQAIRPHSPLRALSLAPPHHHPPPRSRAVHPHPVTHEARGREDVCVREPLTCLVVKEQRCTECACATWTNSHRRCPALHRLFCGALVVIDESRMGSSPTKDTRLSCGQATNINNRPLSSSSSPSSLAAPAPTAHSPITTVHHPSPTPGPEATGSTSPSPASGLTAHSHPTGPPSRFGTAPGPVVPGAQVGSAIFPSDDGSRPATKQHIYTATLRTTDTSPIPRAKARSRQRGDADRAPIVRPVRASARSRQPENVSKEGPQRALPADRSGDGAQSAPGEGPPTADSSPRTRRCSNDDDGSADLAL
ncbi:hypothetical protein CDD83_9620 [Cordyceps sp. RAO-2017]|nr:hypothetical protein CDD83_9620 [Cordyceps sp. RAO-2017]